MFYFNLLFLIKNKHKADPVSGMTDFDLKTTIKMIKQSFCFLSDILHHKIFNHTNPRMKNLLRYFS